MAILHYAWPEKTHTRANKTKWTLQAGEWRWDKLEPGKTYRLYQYADPMDSHLDKYALHLVAGEPPALPPTEESPEYAQQMKNKAHRVSMGLVTFTTPCQDGTKYSFHTAGPRLGLLRRWVWSEMESTDHGSGKADFAVARRYADGACTVPVHAGDHSLAHLELSPASLAAAEKDARLVVLPSLYSRDGLPDSIVVALAGYGVAHGDTLHECLVKMAKQSALFHSEI